MLEKIPAYRAVYMAIKQDIRDGVYHPGDLIPTEPELEAKYKVSRTTIRKAIELLAGEGYVRARQGRGTEVMEASTTQRLNTISSITETLIEKGHAVTTRGMCIDRVTAPNYVAEDLSLTDGEIVYRVQRTISVDGQPFGIFVNYVKESLVPGLDKFSHSFLSLYRFFEQQYGIVFESAVERISAIAADFTDSQILHVEIGTPLLYSKRICSNKNGPFEYSVIKLLADKYEYSIYMQGRP